MACSVALINPQKNKIVKTKTIDDIYRNVEQKVFEMNNKLNQKGNKKELYWKVLNINI
jgi:hypothetical protein